MEQQNDRGYSNALGNAKRAVCQRIDLLLARNHLLSNSPRSYIKRIEILNDIGICIPDIVWELVIESRNSMEHEYVIPTHQKASYALGIADLVMKSTNEEINHPTGILLGPYFQCQMRSSGDNHRFTIKEIPKSPSLFFDVFSQSPSVMILDWQDQEARCITQEDICNCDAIALTKIVRDARVHGYSSYGLPEWESIRKILRINEHP